MADNCGESLAHYQEENNMASRALVIPAPCGRIWERDDCACVDVCGSARTVVSVCVLVCLQNGVVPWEGKCTVK